jgi:hypothetical protein
MRHLISATLLLALAACGSGVTVQERPVRVSVPVTVPCVSGERPAEVTPLKQQPLDWSGYTVKQKAELAGAQALRHKSYGSALQASTGACQ